MQEDCEFKDSQSHLVQPCLNKETKPTKQTNTNLHHQWQIKKQKQTVDSVSMHCQGTVLLGGLYEQV